MKKSTSISNRIGKSANIDGAMRRNTSPTSSLGYSRFVSKSTVTQSRVRSEQIQRAVKDVTRSREAAGDFLKAAGIMTVKGNLSPKYK